MMMYIGDVGHPIESSWEKQVPETKNDKRFCAYNKGDRQNAKFCFLFVNVILVFVSYSSWLFKLRPIEGGRINRELCEILHDPLTANHNLALIPMLRQKTTFCRESEDKDDHLLPSLLTRRFDPRRMANAAARRVTTQNASVLMRKCMDIYVSPKHGDIAEQVSNRPSIPQFEVLSK